MPDNVLLSDSELLDAINFELNALQHELSTNEFALVSLSWKERLIRIQQLRRILNSRT